jgi:hypothetical protein
MKKVSIALTLISALILGSCGIRRYFTYTQWAGDVELYKPRKIVLDDSYVLYTRQIGKAKSDFAVSRANLETLPAANRERMEIQYLLVSEKHNSVIYMTTIPPFHTHDKDHRWIYDEPIFDNTNYVNIWFLNLFFIGKLDPAKQAMLFTRKDQSLDDRWDYHLNNDGRQLTVDLVSDLARSELQHVTAARPDLTLSLPLVFYRQPDLKLGISGFWQDSKFSKGVTLTGDLKALYYANSGKQTDVFFNIGKDPDLIAKGKKPEDLPDDWVHFSNQRTRYRPDK